MRVDLKMQKNWAKGNDFDKSIYEKHTEKLKEVVGKFGWPTLTMVGKKANWGAWLLVQHSDHDISFQKKALRLMRAAAKKNPQDILKQNIAFLQDRILVNSKKKQLYGSQFRWNKKNKLVLSPVRDMKNIEARRKEYNMPPLQDYLDSAKEQKLPNKK